MLEVEVAATVGSLELDVSLAAPHLTTIVGPNGAGKSSLLRAILGIVRPRRGRIELGGERLFGDGIDVAPERRRIGYVPQRYALFSHMTVAANVGFGVRGVDPATRRERVDQLLADLGIDHLADRDTPSLSGGEAQRVALARALAIGPRAMLLDEPMAALDVGARRRVRGFLLERLEALAVPTLVVSHDLDDLEAFGGSVVVLEAGRVTQQGSLAELRAAPATPFVDDFVHR